MINWDAVEWVFLDMDGTVLDLAYDNWFWREHLPEQHARHHGISVEESQARLEPQFRAVMHTLPWYSTEYWSGITGLDVGALKRATRARVAVLPGALNFMQAVRASGRQLWLATNAHPESWTVKLEQTELRPLFEQVICSHDYGAPKESQEFWRAFHASHPFDPARALFVDDSLLVCRAAREFGIGQIIALAHPDSSALPRDVSEFSFAHRLAELPLPPSRG